MNRTMMRNLCVIVPVYNEENTIEIVLGRLLALSFVQEIIVVDDGSHDQTPAILAGISACAPRVQVITQPSNFGKTEAIKTALPHIQAEIVIIQDADLEYDPDEIQYVIEPIWQGQADVVYGSRFLVRKASRVLYYYHYLGNKVITFLSNVFTNKNMTDIETCYKAFRTPLVANMPIRSKGFGFEIEVTARIARTSARIYETPISYYGRTYEEGKKIDWKDGVKALWYIFRFNLIARAEEKHYRDDVRRVLQHTVHQERTSHQPV